MAHSDLKITTHLTDAQFKASLDECNNYLCEYTLALLVFLQKMQKDLEELDPENFDTAYTNTLAKELYRYLSNVADLGRTTLDRLVARSCLLTAREEARRKTADEVARLRSQLAQILLRRGGGTKRKEEA